LVTHVGESLLQIGNPFLFLLDALLVDAIFHLEGALLGDHPVLHHGHLLHIALERDQILLEQMVRVVLVFVHLRLLLFVEGGVFEFVIEYLLGLSTQLFLQGLFLLFPLFLQQFESLVAVLATLLRCFCL